MLIRFQNSFGSFVLRDPEPIDSDHFGVCFKAEYHVEGEEFAWQVGHFPLRSATLIEQVPEQLVIR